MPPQIHRPAPVTVVVIPQPTVNGPLHIGHLSGPYLAADVAARAARARGERVLALAGFDISPNYVLTKAEVLDMDVGEMVALYWAQIASAFDGARIGYDTFLDRRWPDYRRAIAGMLEELVARDTLPIREVTLHQCSDCGRMLQHSYVVGKCPVCGTGSNGTSCEGCGGFTPAQVLIDPSCARCGGSPRPLMTEVPVLPLEDYRERLTQEWLHGEWPARVRSLLQRYQSAPLPDIPVAYPADWGTECHGRLAGLRVDSPTELGLSYLYGPARTLLPEADGLDEWVAAWNEIDGVWYFGGMDSAFYFAILYPAILAAAGVPGPQARGAIVNELYLLDGKKFSTSRNHAVWADEFLASEDPALVRLYLSWDRPDRYKSDFTYEAFRAFCDYVKPLLDGTPAPAGTPSAALAQADLERSERALRLTGFDPALAIRCLLGALAVGTGSDSVAMAALTGRGFGPPAGGV